MNKEQIRQYFMVFILSLAVAGVFSLYLFYRRGYYDLFVLNKVLASASLALLGIVLLIGPLSRFYNRFDKWLIYRREIGISAFFMALAHIAISFFFLSDRFNPSFFQKNSRGILWGLIALALLAILYITSFEKIIKRINKKLWIEIQSWGIRIGTFLVLLHLVILKYAGWLKWLKEGGAPELAQPNFPPASLLGALFIAFVGIIRFGELFGKTAGKWIFVISFVGLLLVFVILFILAPWSIVR